MLWVPKALPEEAFQGRYHRGERIKCAAGGCHEYFGNNHSDEVDKFET